MTTLAEIARLVGVTPATVSRALNDKPGVSAAVRARILAEAARLNFVVNGAAQSLRTAQTMTVALVLARPQADHLASEPFYGPIMLGIEQELQEQGYHLLVATLTEDRLARPERWSIVRGRADGLIITSPVIPERFILDLHRNGMPIVLVDNAVDKAPIDTVLAEDRIGARQLAEHILEHGHRRIVILSGPDAWVTNRERCLGFLEALHAAGLEPLAVLHAEQTHEVTGYRLMSEALAYQPTAVLAINDRMAMGAIDAAHTAGIAVPADVAVTGFDDIAPVARMDPPLTTVHISTVEIGRCAASQLLRRIARPDAPRQRTLVATSLVVRRSCGCEAAPARTYLQMTDGAHASP